MRPIKFRGLSEDGVWYFGYYEKYHGRHRITNEELYGNKIYFVDGKTIGQFTGLLNKNGKEIYEGDIVREWTPPNGFGESNVYYIIRYYGDGFYFYNTHLKAITSNWNLRNLAEHYEVIGNIHENPDLLTK